MRGRIRAGVVAFSVAGVLGVLGRVGVSVALDERPVGGAEDFGPAPQVFDAAADQVSMADFGPRPRELARVDADVFPDHGTRSRPRRVIGGRRPRSRRTTRSPSRCESLFGRTRRR